MRRSTWIIPFSFVLVVSCTEDGRTPAAPDAGRSDIAPLYSGSGPAIPDAYIVVLKKGATPDIEAAGVSALPRYRYHSAIVGFAADLTPGQLNALQHNPNVDYIEPDRVVVADVTQNMISGQPWGLDRIDQRARPLSMTYTYNNNGSGVHVYVIDTGIRYTHVDFGGRASFSFDAFGGNGVDCDGHGTHVSGTIGGTTYGVAKGVTLHGVRVLNCVGSGTLAGVIAGVDWVTSNHASPAVANMSLHTGASTAMDQAVASSISSGVVYAVAAANDSTDACTDSPARVPQAITVAATGMTDARPSFSNFGTCVDLFAPGVSVKSDYATSNTATALLSGTLMASPHAAGVAALYLQNNPGATPAMVGAALNANATLNVVTNPGPGTPNRLLYMGFLGPSLPSIAIVSGNNQTGPPGSLLPQALVARVTDGGGAALAGAVVTFSVLSGGGSLSAVVDTSDALGNVSTMLTLGPTAGADSVRASLSTGGSVTFVATAQSGVFPQVAIFSGNNQSGPVGTQLPQLLVVRVTDAGGNPVANQLVTFTVALGGGTVGAPEKTGPLGKADTYLILGPAAGPNTVRASLANGNSVLFTANGTGGVVLQIAVASGNNQNGNQGSVLTTPLVARVTDGTNPVSGITVTFAAYVGGGSVNPLTAVTNSLGEASTQLTLGINAGPDSVSATLSNGARANFGATALAVPQIAIQTGNNQTGTINTALTNPLVVKVTDLANVPLSGINVTFNAYFGGGSVSPTVVATNSLGEASTTLTLGPTAGQDSVSAILPNGARVNFRATAQAPPPAVNIAIFSGNNQSAPAGTQLPQLLVVRVTDAAGNPLANETVTFTVQSGGGTVLVASDKTGPLGKADTPFKLGPSPGQNTVKATTRTGTFVIFTATGN